MISQATLVERFNDGATSGQASNMYIEGKVLYSYGSHFPLAVRGNWGADIKHLLNGDRYSVSTSAHQQLCIDQLEKNVQVPFSALEAAGLLTGALPIQGLQVVSWRSDSYYYTCAQCGREINGSKLHRDDQTPLCPKTEGRRTHLHHLLGAVVLKHKRRFFLSSVDDQEHWSRSSYFLCELPRPVPSVEEAFACLVPDAVSRARKCGANVRRQGDIFCVATALNTRQIPARTKRAYPVFGTTHVATEVRKTDERVFIRGTVRHRPEGRPSQHAMLRLGKACWWQAFKNTALGSWNARGGID